jgi:hypothetical protein
LEDEKGDSERQVQVRHGKAREPKARERMIQVLNNEPQVLENDQDPDINGYGDREITESMGRLAVNQVSEQVIDSGDSDHEQHQNGFSPSIKNQACDDQDGIFLWQQCIRHCE